ncbi:hypothetical protein C3L33_12068, partial [Rhododendron williamsianum]
DSCLEVVYRMYWLCYHIHTYKKTQVALVNGISMGGGASLMVPMRFSVVTEKTVSFFMILSMIMVLICSSSNAIYLFIYLFWASYFNFHATLKCIPQVFATPEASIGHHTDCGFSTCYPIFPGIWVSIFLPPSYCHNIVSDFTTKAEVLSSVLNARVKSLFIHEQFHKPRTNMVNEFVLFLSILTLCGYACRRVFRLNRSKVEWQGSGCSWTCHPFCSFRVIHIPFYECQKLLELEKKLISLNSGDVNAVKSVIEEFSVEVQIDEESVLKKQAVIDECFSKDTVEEILKSLEMELGKEGNAWIGGVLKGLKRSSPTGLKIALRSVIFPIIVLHIQIREGRITKLSECLKKEFRLTINILRSTISGDIYEVII